MDRMYSWSRSTGTCARWPARQALLPSIMLIRCHRARRCIRSSDAREARRDHRPDPAHRPGAAGRARPRPARQLVGLVEYDDDARPVPGHRLGRGGVVGRQRHPGRAVLPGGLRHGAGRLLRPGDRQPRPPRLRAAQRRRPVRAQGRASTRRARCSTTTAATATASSTSPSRCPTSTAASRHARAQGATILEEPHDVTDEHGTVRLAAIATYGDTRHTPRRPLPLRRPLPARLRRAPIGHVAARGRAAAAVPGARPRRRQRRARPDGRVGRLLQPGHGLHQHGRVRRRRHRHRVLGADEQGRRQRQPPGQVPAQRAGGRQEALADRRVPRLLRRPRRPAPRAGHQRHPHHRRRAAGRAAWSSSTPRTRYYTDPELRARIGEVRVPIEELQRAASSSTATRTATCCRSSPSRSATARRCSSSSSSGTARWASARATSRRCSRRSSASRPGAATSDPGRIVYVPPWNVRRGTRRGSCWAGGPAPSSPCTSATPPAPRRRAAPRRPRATS